MLFVIVVVLTLVWIDPVLQYPARAPVFYLEWPFLRSFLLRPGGPLEWLAACLLQWYLWPWAAVLITAAIIAAAGWAAYIFFAALGQGKPAALSLLALVPLVALQAHYYAPVLEITLGFTLVGTLLAAYARRPPESTGIAVSVVLGITALVYSVAGGFVLLFALLGALFDLRKPQRRWIVVFTWLVSAALLPWVAHEFELADTLSGAYLQSLWLRRSPMAAVLYGVLLTVALLLWLHAGNHLRWAARPISWLPTSTWLRLGLVAGLMLVAAWTARNPHHRALLRLDYHARHQNWPAVLAQVPHLDMSGVRPGQIPAALITAFFDIRRALFHTGRLSDDLFSQPCPAGMPLLPNTAQGFFWCIPASELLLELGHVNYAEHWAHEALEIQGERPGILTTLATVNQLLDRPEAARVFLNRLARNPVWGARARRRLAQLEVDPSGEQDPQLQHLRSVMVKTDDPSPYLEAETLLRQALSANPRNRMAFEYLMAHHLLHLELASAVGLMRRSAEVGLTNLPRHYGEAWVLADRVQPTNAPAPPGLEVNPATRERFQAFEARTRQFRNDPRQLRAALAAEYADTFWFYYWFGETPGRGARLAGPP